MSNVNSKLQSSITRCGSNFKWLSFVALTVGVMQISHSSDIEIYQAKPEVSPTLMFLLDISGSMTSRFPTQSVAIEACDIPSDYQFSSFGIDSATTSTPYARSYCNAISENNTTYFFRRVLVRISLVRSRYDYYSCGTNGSSDPSKCTNLIGAPSAATLNRYSQSGSGNTTYYFQYDQQRFYDRITKVKDGMFTLLRGSSTVSQLADDKVLGLSAFSYTNGSETNKRGYIITPARTLNTMVGNKTQRTILLEEIAKLNATGGTPTAHAYAETAAYLMGTTTQPSDVSGMDYATAAGIKNTATQYKKPETLSRPNAQCAGQGIYVLTDGQPNATTPERSRNIMNNALTSRYASSQICSANILKLSEIKGAYRDIYQSSWPVVNGDDNAWLCIGDFSQRLLNQDQNPLGKSIKTAVVGFGSQFKGIQSYNPALSKEANLANVQGEGNVQNAAKWGIGAEGGWYYGENAQDVVDSFKQFIDNTPGDISPITTGAATVPLDNLNPLALRNKAYFSQFQPTPSNNYQLWLGNLKQYEIIDGFLTDQKKNKIQNSTGEIVSNYDFWANSETDLIGGVQNKLPLGLKSDTEFKRTLWTDRTISGSTNETSLRKIGFNDLNGSDPDRGYLLSLLGYNIDVRNVPTTLDALKRTSELRQMGALLHSSPLLLTNEGVIKVDNGKIVTSQRSDYIVFGTTQGLLHVVDAVTGVEKFAFVPNELIKVQKDAFSKVNSTTGGLDSLFYGVDAPWTSYTEYVTKNSATGAVTVGSGENNTTGKQIIYGGLRMGGRGYYALDLKNIDSPSVLFHISPEDQKVFSQSENISSKNYPELDFMGQSWAKPTTAWVNWQNKKRLVMFVSGGYDAGGDDGNGTFEYSAGKRGKYTGYESPAYEQSNKKGAGVYMFDALTGELLWWASANQVPNNVNSTVQYTNAPDMKYSVVSQIRTVDRNLDGLVDHLYFGDLGGQLWRIDLNNDAKTDHLFAKTPVRLMNLHNGQYSPRFYEMPAFSVYRDNNKLFGVLSIGAGNRSSPMFNTTNSNYKDDAIYNVFDKDVVKANLFNIKTNDQGTDEYTNEGGLNSQNALLGSEQIEHKIVKLGDANVTQSAGWYYSFQNTASGTLQAEKVMQMPIVVSNDMYVTTFNSLQTNSSDGNCGAAVNGKSYVSLFCMPYGQCAGGVQKNEIGMGIVSPSVASPTSDGYDRTLVSTVASILNGSKNPFNQYKNHRYFILKSWSEEEVSHKNVREI
ncbi:pilus assembly protein PilY [Acinetobacter sp. B10A]|uniref:PilC/PilY family type IV pilus protein n=1 Tax=Acinetobacter baretiae TaxID=2605383 RepID=UPI001B3C4D53|nr:PilC/PilY family type IV pilus protein [Acinetobacter baretiae]MBF7686177.1 pilus assembly protein PilY [Acinetobacter baretiae]